MRVTYLIIGLFALLVLQSCKGSSKATTNTKKKVDEDLTKYMYKPKVVEVKTETPTVANTQGIAFEKHINAFINPSPTKLGKL